MIKRNCVHCEKEFECYKYQVEKGEGKFCSVNCKNLSRRKTDEEKKIKNSLRVKKWRKNNPDYIKGEVSVKYKKSWYKKNKEKILKDRKEYYNTHKAEVKKYRENNKEKISSYNKTYLKTDTAKVSIKNSQHRRRLIESESDIDNKWLSEQKNLALYCPNCEIFMDNDGRKMQGKTIDHVISLGCGGWHKKDNIWYICRKCNLSRPKDNSDLKVILKKIELNNTYLLEQDKKALVNTIKNYIDLD